MPSLSVQMKGFSNETYGSGRWPRRWWRAPLRSRRRPRPRARAGQACRAAPRPAPPGAAAAAPAAPAAPPFPEGAKVAFVVLQRIANESADGKQRQRQVQALQQKKAAELTDKQKQLQAPQQKLEKERRGA